VSDDEDLAGGIALEELAELVQAGWVVVVRVAEFAGKLRSPAVTMTPVSTALTSMPEMPSEVTFALSSALALAALSELAHEKRAATTARHMRIVTILFIFGSFSGGRPWRDMSLPARQYRFSNFISQWTPFRLDASLRQTYPELAECQMSREGLAFTSNGGSAMAFSDADQISTEEHELDYVLSKWGERTTKANRAILAAELGRFKADPENKPWTRTLFYAWAERTGGLKDNWRISRRRASARRKRRAPIPQVTFQRRREGDGPGGGGSSPPS
jgi:hypothetical protein